MNDDWKPSAKCLSNLKEKYGEINYDNETDKFINYHLAKGSVFVDAERAYLNWIRNAVNFRAKDKRFEQFKKDKVSSRKRYINMYISFEEGPLTDDIPAEDPNRRCI